MSIYSTSILPDELSFKVTLIRTSETEIRRFRASRELYSLDAMKDLVKLWWPNFSTKQACWEYVDPEDEDLITLSTQSEWDECLRLHTEHSQKLIRLTIRRQKKKEKKSAEVVNEEDEEEEDEGVLPEGNDEVEPDPFYDDDFLELEPVLLLESQSPQFSAVPEDCVAPEVLLKEFQQSTNALKKAARREAKEKKKQEKLEKKKLQKDEKLKKMKKHDKTPSKVDVVATSHPVAKISFADPQDRIALRLLFGDLALASLEYQGVVLESLKDLVTLIPTGEKEDTYLAVIDSDAIGYRCQRRGFNALREHCFPDALAYLQQATRLCPNNNIAHYNHAAALARCGEKEAAMQSLCIAVEKGYAHSLYLLRDQNMNCLRDHPLFEPIVAKMRGQRTPVTPLAIPKIVTNTLNGLIQAVLPKPVVTHVDPTPAAPAPVTQDSTPTVADRIRLLAQKEKVMTLQAVFPSFDEVTCERLLESDDWNVRVTLNKLL